LIRISLKSNDSIYGIYFFLASATNANTKDYRQIVRRARKVPKKDMLTAINREHVFSGKLVTQREDRAILGSNYGLGESGIIGIPLLGFGESGIIGIPLLGFGESGIIGIPLLGFGESGIIGIPLLGFGESGIIGMPLA